MSFSFVHYDGPRLPTKPHVRKLIRQRAMRDIATARKQRGNYGKNNLVQYPVFVDANEDCLSYSHTASGDQKEDAVDDESERGQLATFYQPLWASKTPIKSIDTTMPKDFALLLDLMPLTGLRLGIAPFSYLTSFSTYRDNLTSFRQPGSRKLLSFIPSRYGHVPALRHATDCVVAKLRYITQSEYARPANGEEIILKHHNKALKSLQSALDDEAQRLLPETLCATELLGIFEALNDNSQAQSWIRHVSGAARLIEIRGPHRFSTEFEMSLFMAHVGPTVMEAFMNDKPCFLVEESWQNVMHSAIYNDESLANKKDMSFTLWRNLVRLPALFKETAETIAMSDPSKESVDNLAERISSARRQLLWWLDNAQERTNLHNETIEWGEDGFESSLHLIESNEVDSGFVAELALRGTFTACRMIKSRLLYALAPSRFRNLEDECQALASKITNLGEYPLRDEKARVIWNTIMAQCIWVAKGILQTKEIWSEGWTYREGVIDKWKFDSWRAAIGTKINLA